ncbi:MAG: CinA family protein [Dehalococcoidia bacterium]
MIGTAAEVVATLTRLGLTLAVAESCTGGLVGHLLTDVPGSSRVFPGGVVAYDNRSKRALLGVPADLLIAHGAVSAEVASAMADGVRRAFGTDIGVGITGVAGPTGGSDEKPVGTVFIACAHRGITVERYHWTSEHDGNPTNGSGLRARNKHRSAVAALELVLRCAGDGAVEANVIR